MRKLISIVLMLIMLLVPATGAFAKHHAQRKPASHSKHHHKSKRAKHASHPHKKKKRGPASTGHAKKKKKHNKRKGRHHFSS